MHLISDECVVLKTNVCVFRVRVGPVVMSGVYFDDVTTTRNITLGAVSSFNDVPVERLTPKELTLLVLGSCFVVKQLLPNIVK